MNLILRNHHTRALPIRLRPAAFSGLFDHVLDDMFAPQTKSTTEQSVRRPRIELSETEYAYSAEVELPGVGKNDVKVTMEKQLVTVEAEVRRTVDTKVDDVVTQTEEISRKYAHSFVLEQEIDDANATAKMENGILFLTLPKKTAPASKQLTIQ
jgi:HSP20 family protein